MPPRQAEHALGDDVPLDLVRTAVDRVRAGEQVQPLGVVQLRTGGDQRPRAAGTHRQLAEPAVPLRPQQLPDGDLRPGRPPERPQRVRAQDAQPDPGAGEVGAQQWVVVGTGALRLGDDVVEFAAEADLLAEGGDAAFEAEGGHRDLPAVAGFADDELGGRAGVVEEDFVELRGAGELLDRPHGDAVLAQRHEQVGQAVVALGAGFGAGHDEAPVGHVRQRRPDLLAVDHPVAVAPDRRRRDGGQVGAGAGLGVALAPEFFDGDDLRQEPFSLLGRAEGDEGRAEQLLADVVDARGCTGRGVLLVEGDLLVERQAAAAVFDGPADAGPARRGQVPFPGQAQVERLVLAAGSAQAA